jgi:hypothetical protein
MPVTQFFAMPEETQEWLEAEIKRLKLITRDDRLAGGLRQCLLWPRDEPPLADTGRVTGVMVQFPETYDATLTMGVTGWKASAVPEPAASRGRRLSQQLARSLREMATVPLYAISYDGDSRSDKADVWGTPAAVSAGMSLRQWRDGVVTFQP